MPLEISENIRTASSEDAVLDSVYQALKKISHSTRKVGGKVISHDINPTLGARLWRDSVVETTVKKTASGGIFVCSEVKYRPSILWWFLLFLAWTGVAVVLWLITLVFFFTAKKGVRDSIERAQKRVKDEHMT